jgi:8-oxo-dGTP pyrophosphatase MutT (NUDIX family)
MPAPFVEPLARVLAAHPAVIAPREPEYQEAAVSLLLRDSGGPELLFILRAVREGDPWSGHIAFPGGRRQVSDATLRDTARRETTEEIGLDPEAVGRYAGALDELEPSTKRLPPVIISPFVWTVPADVSVVPAAEEVESVLWVGLETLRDPASEVDYEFRGLHFPGLRVGGHVLWGLSYRIVLAFLPLAREAGL